MKLLAASVLLCLIAVPMAQAKLPAPSAEAQLKADEAKAKTAWSDKVAAYQLCKAMDRSAEAYFKTAKSEGKEVHAPTATPPCTDPGPYAPAGAASAAKPLEAAGAHSPAATATSPPSGKATQADLQGTKTK